MVVREIMIVFGAVLALGVIAVGIISALIVEKTPSQASFGAFPYNSAAVIAAAENAIGIKKGPPDHFNLGNARDVKYDESHDVMFCRVDLLRGDVIVNDYKYPVGFTFMAKAPTGQLVEPYHGDGDSPGRREVQMGRTRTLALRLTRCLRT